MTTASLFERNIAFKLNIYKNHIVQLSRIFKKPLKEHLPLNLKLNGKLSLGNNTGIKYKHFT